MLVEVPVPAVEVARGCPSVFIACGFGFSFWPESSCGVPPPVRRATPASPIRLPPQAPLAAHGGDVRNTTGNAASTTDANCFASPPASPASKAEGPARTKPPGPTDLEQLAVRTAAQHVGAEGGHVARVAAVDRRVRGGRPGCTQPAPGQHDRRRARPAAGRDGGGRDGGRRRRTERHPQRGVRVVGRVRPGIVGGGAGRHAAPGARPASTAPWWLIHCPRSGVRRTPAAQWGSAPPP